MSVMLRYNADGSLDPTFGQRSDNSGNGGLGILYTTINDSSRRIGHLLGETGRFYVRGGVPMRHIADGDEIKLDVMRPAAACSDFEHVAKLVEWKESEKSGPDLKPTVCREHIARQIVSSEAFREQLPPITLLSRCPVLVERNGRLETITGYDRESGIWATGDAPHAMSVEEAKRVLNDLLADFTFATPGDHSRALAAIITPALVFGGLLGGRAPVDVGEADDSQAGKGYRNKLTCAIYRHSPKTVTQRERGVGSLQETFDAKLVSGACFIALDNLRGKLDSMGIESFLTEPTYSARVPYAQPIEIETARIIVMLTTNKAELTRDMANRSSVVRIRKRGDNHTFRNFPEGDLLAHVQANQPRFLGAVFAVVREWHRRGKPRQSDTQHDFRAWASSLGWIVENLLQAAPLLEGHRDVQARIANPAAGWLRDVAMAVRSQGKTGQWLRVGQLLEIILEAGIETQGVESDANTDDEAVFVKSVQAVGRKLSKAIGDAEIQVDDVLISRRQSTDDKGRPKNEYQFKTPLAPHRPESFPYENSCFPDSPYDHQSLLHARAHEKSSAPIGDIGGHKGKKPECTNCDHINPNAWVTRDGKSYCRSCNKFIGNLAPIRNHAVAK